MSRSARRMGWPTFCLKIHPFQDGNGRLSRLLTNLLLLKSGYAFVPYVSLEKIIERRRQDYYLALRRRKISEVGMGRGTTYWPTRK